MRTKENNKQQASNLDGCYVIDDLVLKLSSSLRTAKRLNEFIVDSTTDNCKDDPQYEQIQQIFDVSCELEIILENIGFFIDCIPEFENTMIDGAQKFKGCLL